MHNTPALQGLGEAMTDLEQTHLTGNIKTMLLTTDALLKVFYVQAYFQAQ